MTRVHYEEIRIHGTFHHTPSSFRESFRLIATRAVEPARFVSNRMTLAELPENLLHPAPGLLKTLVVF